MNKCVHVNRYHTVAMIMLTSFYAPSVWQHTYTSTKLFHYIENENVFWYGYTSHRSNGNANANFGNVVTIFSFFSLSSYHHHFEAVFISWFGNWFEYTVYIPFIHTKGEKELLCTYTKAHIGARRAFNQWSNSIIHGMVISVQKFSKLSHANLSPSHPHH